MAYVELLVLLLSFAILSIANDRLHAPVGLSSFKQKNNERTNLEKTHFDVVFRRKFGPRDSLMLDDIIHLNVRQNDISKLVFLESKTKDMTYLGWSLFYKEKIQAHKVILQGEADLGEPSYYSICFITVFNAKEVVDFDEMRRLFKMKKGSKTKADIDLGNESMVIELEVDKGQISQFGSNLEKLCSNADHIYSSSSAVSQVANGDKDLEMKVLSSTRRLLANNESSPYPLCIEASSMWDLGCICTMQICMPWYPCGLKNCSVAKVNIAGQSRHDCGLATCQKCKHVKFFVDRRMKCFWDKKGY